MFRPIALFALLLSALALASPPRPATAQESQVWIQIEAQPTLAEAEERARAYAGQFPETAGFRLGSGWYGIVLGPFPEAEARERLSQLTRQRMIPRDSFIAFPRNLGAPFWPPEDPLSSEPPAMAEAPPEPAEIPAQLPDETAAEARGSEAQLTEDERKALQTALQWFGFYEGGIDGAFGSGTRNSMSAWQEAQGQEPTGVLTTRQRRALLDAWRGETEALGFAEVVEDEAGITVTLPLGLVEFDHYEPPFVHFRPKSGSGPQIVLISQPGDQAAFYGLYDVLQTLDSVPLSGERERTERTFRIRGSSATVETTVQAQLTGGLIKGWMYISTPGNEARDARILRMLERSFTPRSDKALDPGMVTMSTETKAGLLAGLQVRTPRLSRSGLFVDASGAVLTTLEAVETCGRITIDRATEASVTLSDAGTGLALLKPAAPLSPRAVAEFQLAPERPGTEVVVAGYPYEDRLPAPVMTFGTLEEVTGLDGEAGVKRLSLPALPGDAGGPVLDATGAVIGMLLPRISDPTRQLPEGVHFAAAGAELARVLSGAGITPRQAERRAALPPSDLSAMGLGMTALVSCWD